MSRIRLTQISFLASALVFVASASFAGLSSADLSITKTDGVTSATPGTSVTYTIVTSNAGSSDVTGASVTDTFPTGLTCTWTCSASAGSSCTASGTGSISDSADLLNGGSATYTASCLIDSSLTGNLSNTATISSATSDPNNANNSATDLDTLAPSADLAISMVVTPNPALLGSDLTIDVTVTNNGPSDATAVAVSGTLPSFATFVSTSGCAEDPNGDPTCTLGTIPAGQTASFSMTAKVTGIGSGTMGMSVASPVSDPVSSNNAATEAMTAQSTLEIPTASESGLLLLGLLLLAAAVWLIRR